MTAPLPFTVHAALPCQPHAGFAASLAAELGALRRGRAGARARGAGVLPVLGWSRSAAVVRAGALRVRADGGVDDLLIDRVVTRAASGTTPRSAVVPLRARGRRARHAGRRGRRPRDAALSSRHEDGLAVAARGRRTRRAGRRAHGRLAGARVALPRTTISDVLLQRARQRRLRAGDGDLTRRRCAAGDDFGVRATAIRRAGAGERGAAALQRLPRLRLTLMLRRQRGADPAARRDEPGGHARPRRAIDIAASRLQARVVAAIGAGAIAQVSSAALRSHRRGERHASSIDRFGRQHDRVHAVIVVVSEAAPTVR